MGQRLIISDNQDDPDNSLILDGEALDVAAQDPLAIGKLMVDQVWTEGTDPTGGGLYYERSGRPSRSAAWPRPNARSEESSDQAGA